MKLSYRRLARVSLDTPVSDPLDRNTMPMSTLIESDFWLLETSWDGAAIGDIQVFKNAACGQNGVRMKDDKKKGVDGLALDRPDEWVWWAGVPRGKVTSYRFADQEHPVPQTVGQEALPFELDPPANAQRKEKSLEAGARGGPSA